MKNNINRNHWIYIAKNLISMIKNSLFLFIVLAVNKNRIYYIGAVLILMVIISVLEWRKNIFYINGDLLVHEEGFISKSKEEIPFNKINTIDVGQSLIDRTFHVSTMKIDTGSAIAEKSELKITKDNKYIEELKETLLSLKKIDKSESDKILKSEKETYEIKKVITFGELVKYALTKSKVGWAIGVFFVLNKFMDDIGRFFDLSFSTYISNNINLDFIKSKSVTMIVGTLITVLILLYVLITIVSIIFEAVRLYNFTVKSDKQKISVSYGFLSKKQYSFSIDKIYGLRYKQSILQQMLNIYTVEIISIGYGDENNESALLYPIADKNFKENFIKKLLPIIDFNGEVNEPPKSSLKRFILKRFILSLVILVTLCIFIKIVPQNIKLSISIIIMIFCLLLGYLNYKNSSLGVSKGSIIASEGNFSKITTIIRQDTVQSITKAQGIFQKMGDKVCDYKIDLYSNKLGDVIHVRHMSESIYVKLQKNLIL